MTNRDNLVKIYLTDEEKAQFTRWADEAGKTQSELGRDAILEYLDKDRAARIEDKLDRVLDALDSGEHTHTKTSRSKNSVPETARQVAKHIHANYETPIKGTDVELAIENIAEVGDERSVAKYKDQLKKRNLLFKHPHQPVWTDMKDEWVEWVENATVNPDISEMTADYGIDTDEYIELANTIDQ